MGSSGFPARGFPCSRARDHELPLVIDEVPVLALLAAHARAARPGSWERRASRQESDRLTGGRRRHRDPRGARRRVEGEDLVVSGGGLAGGVGAGRRRSPDGDGARRIGPGR